MGIFILSLIYLTVKSPCSVWRPLQGTFISAYSIRNLEEEDFLAHLLTEVRTKSITFRYYSNTKVLDSLGIVCICYRSSGLEPMIRGLDANDSEEYTISTAQRLDTVVGHGPESLAYPILLSRDS